MAVFSLLGSMRPIRHLLFLLLAGCASGRAAVVRSPEPVASAATSATSDAAATKPRDARASLAQFVDSMVDAPEFRSAHWGVLVVDPVRAETLYAHNADKLFVPASNMKLVTGVTALVQLGVEHRWTTTLLARGAVRGGVLEGDLVARGDGDPSFSAHMHLDALEPLRGLADSLRAHGVTRVRGRVVAAPSPFTDAPLGFGWEWDDLDESYGAGVDALYFNEGFTEVVVHAGARAGDLARASTRPATTYPSLIVQARTVARAATAADSVAGGTHVTVGYDSSHAGVRVAGTIALGDSAVVELAFRDQQAAFLAALREALRSRGITIDEARTDSSAKLDSLVALRSPTLRDVLPFFEKPSQNQIGEILFKSIALKTTGVGRADSASSVIARQLVAWGAAPDGFAVRDGSGLSRHDFVSPRTLVHVLDAARRHPDFRAFYDALPIAGIDGTIGKRMRGTAAQGNVHAKTGLVDKARSLSGYVTTTDGRMLLFSALCNNYSVPTKEVERVQDALAVRLATLGAPTP